MKDTAEFRRGQPSYRHIPREEYLARAYEFAKRGDELPHSKFTSKQAAEIRSRVEKKRARLAFLRSQKAAIEKEISRLVKTDTTRQLCAEYGVSKTTIERISSYETYWRN